MINIVIISLAYLEYDEVLDVNPLNGSLSEEYEQIFNFSSIGNLSSFYSKNLIKTVSQMRDYTYKNSSDLSKPRNITETIVLYENNETESEYMKFYFSGFYNPGLERGVMQGTILLSPPDYYNELYNNSEINKLLSDDDFPNNVVFNNNTTDECTNTACCDDLMNYFTITPVTRPILRNKYMPDISYHYTEATKINSTSENVSFIESRIISTKCEIDMMVSGEIYNTAFKLNSSLIYSFLFIFIQLLSILSGIREVYLLTSPQRLEKISSVSFLMESLYDIIMVAFYINQSGESRYTEVPIYVSSILLAIMVVVVDGYILIMSLQYNQMGERFFNIAMFAFFILLLLYFVMYEWITDTVNFIIILLASSYWFVQSIEGAVKDIGTKMLAFDFIIVQTIAKYAPVIYFYGVPDNFVGIEVEYWFLPSMLGWFSLEFVFLILQFFFGGRLISPLLAKYKKNSKSSSNKVYDYNEQHIHMFSVRVMEDFIRNDDLLRNAETSNTEIFKYLKEQGRSYPIMFSDVYTKQSLLNQDEDDLGSSEFSVKEVGTASRESLQQEEKESDESQLTMEIIQEIKQTCQNPLHVHSLFYNPNIHISDLKDIIPYFAKYGEQLNKWKNKDTCCFHLIEQKNADTSFSCSICMDDLEVMTGMNNYIRCFNVDFRDNDMNMYEDKKSKKNHDKKHKNENYLIEKEEEDIVVANEDYITHEADFNQRNNKSTKELENQIIFITPCGHMFHRDCIAKWAAEECQCPVDREQIPPVPTKAWWE